MSNKEMITEIRQLDNFNYIILNEYHEGVVNIVQGDKESLEIEAPPEVLKRIETKVEDSKLIIKTGGTFLEKLGGVIKTSLNRQKVNYYLTVRELFGIEISGIVKANLSSIRTNYFILKFNGVGKISCKSLIARFLEVKLSNVGKIELEGKVGEQKISIQGSSNYHAGELESSKAVITLNGIGKATLWVKDELDATLKGMGNISYYGEPADVKKNITQVSSFTSLGLKK